MNLIDRKHEKEERQSWALNIENKRRASLDLEAFNSYKEMEDHNDNKKINNDEQDSEIDIDNDYLLNEGLQILSDYAMLSQIIYLSKAA